MLDYLYRNKNAIADVSLHVTIASIARNMKGKLFKEQIILQAAKIARSVGATSISYIATSNNDIERARRVGFKVSKTMLKSQFAKGIFSLEQQITQNGPMNPSEVSCVLIA